MRLAFTHNTRAIRYSHCSTQRSEIHIHTQHQTNSSQGISVLLALRCFYCRRESETHTNTHTCTHTILRSTPNANRGFLQIITRSNGEPLLENGGRGRGGARQGGREGRRCEEGNIQRTTRNRSTNVAQTTDSDRSKPNTHVSMCGYSGWRRGLC